MLKPDVEKNLGIMLHDYQKKTKDFIKKNPYCALFLTMGLGKTLTTLSALYELDLPGNILVIAPKNIARSTWLDEIKKWKFPLKARSFIVDKNDKPLSKAKRFEAYSEAIKATYRKDYAIYFINRELIPDLIKHCEWIFPYVVIDESQSFKNHASERFKALKSVRLKIKRLIELSGTPAPNGPMDLWAQIYLLDGGERLGRNITAYRDAYFYPTIKVNGYNVGWKVKPHAEHEIYRKISDISISMKNTNLKVPPVTMVNHKVYLSKKERKLYDTMKKDLVLSVTMENEEVNIIAKNAAILSAKLSQMASGALYTADSSEYIIIHKEKLHMCKYIIENSDSPVLIAYHFKSDLDMLKNYLTQNKLEYEVFDGSNSMIKRWNERKIPIMLLQPASAGHGLNLQNGGSTLIWYTIPWSLEEYLQCNARLHRQGQKDPVVIHHLITDESIDEAILRAIERKDMTQNALLEAIKLSIE